MGPILLVSMEGATGAKVIDSEHSRSPVRYFFELNTTPSLLDPPASVVP